MAESRRPRAIFMAFGTKGDVFPIAAIAAAFACDQQQYHVVLITHLAHQSLKVHLAAKNVGYVPVCSPPVLWVHQFVNCSDSTSFSTLKKRVQAQHRQECLSAVEGVLGDYPSAKDDFIVINFFALEGWHLAELFQVQCVVASPYVIPYSAPSVFERQFKQELPHLYRYLQEASVNMISWKDLVHWMWPLFTEDWGTWRREDLKLSPIPFLDPVTNLPLWHMQVKSPPLLYGVSKEVVECPGYWPSNIHLCGFWFLPLEWQFSCDKCRERMFPSPSRSISGKNEICDNHADMQRFLAKSSSQCLPLFIGLSSIGSMGFIKNPNAFLGVLEALIEITEYSFILFSAGYEPLDAAIKSFSGASLNGDTESKSGDSTLLFNDRLYCFSGSVPYSWLFPRCAIAIHHGGSGSTAAALHAGIPQIVCPFILDQFYWAERLHWIGVAPEPLPSQHLLPHSSDAASIRQAADSLARAIRSAQSPEIISQASKVAGSISSEDGLQEALEILKEKVLCPRQ